MTPPAPRRRRMHQLLNLRALQRVGWALAAGIFCAGLAPTNFHLGTRVVAS